MDDDLNSVLDQLTSPNSNLGEVTVPIKYSHYYFDMCRNKELVKFRLIPDNDGVPFKTLVGVRQGNIEFVNQDTGVNDNRRIRICDKSNFKNLTETQSKMIDELNLKLDRYVDFTKTWQFKPIKRITLFYGVLTQLGKIKYNDYRLSVFNNSSYYFVNDLESFVNFNESVYGIEWFGNQFRKDPEVKHVISCLITRPEIKYVTSLNHIELDNPIPISDEIYDSASNLDKEYIDTVNFMEDIYADAINALDSVDYSQGV